VSALVQYAITTAAEHVAEVANPNPTRLHDVARWLLTAHRCVHLRPCTARAGGRRVPHSLTGYGARSQVAAVVHRVSDGHVHRVQSGEVLVLCEGHRRHPRAPRPPRAGLCVTLLCRPPSNVLGIPPATLSHKLCVWGQGTCVCAGAVVGVLPISSCCGVSWGLTSRSPWAYQTSASRRRCTRYSPPTLSLSLSLSRSLSLSLSHSALSELPRPLSLTTANTTSSPTQPTLRCWHRWSYWPLRTVRHAA
jgi:hypothetical protein